MHVVMHEIVSGIQGFLRFVAAAADRILGLLFLVSYICFSLAIVLYVLISFITTRLLLRTRLGVSVQRGWPQRRRVALFANLLVIIGLYAITARALDVSAGIAGDQSPSIAAVNEMWLRDLIPAPIRPRCIGGDLQVCAEANGWEIDQANPTLAWQLGLLLMVAPFGLIAGFTVWRHKMPSRHRTQPPNYGNRRQYV